MNRTSNINQEANSIPDFSCSQSENLAAVHLLAYFKKLKIQKIFRILSPTLERKR